MDRILIINDCNDCCYFSNEYYGYDEECLKLNRVVEENSDGIYEIPDDCPLPPKD